jgi:hypothetical protein
MVSDQGLVSARVALCLVRALELATDLELVADLERRFDAQPLDRLDGVPTTAPTFDRVLVGVRVRALALDEELTRALSAALDLDPAAAPDLAGARTLACHIAQVRGAARGCVLARDLVDGLSRAHTTLARPAADPPVGRSTGRRTQHTTSVAAEANPVATTPTVYAVVAPLHPYRAALRVNGWAVRLLSPAARTRHGEELQDELFDLADCKASWQVQVVCALRQLATVRQLRAAAGASPLATDAAADRERPVTARGSRSPDS